MSTQTEQTASRAEPAQGSHHWVITLEIPGRLTSTYGGTYTPPPGATRSDVYQAIRGDITRQKPELARANVMFFALESNRL
ncbi:hypothetical protein [Streptomyces sp. NPDC004134]|uniref:hypothetical protein n=1 Tax=Streptomyces sp. NPDC004134 TaxID=3364691 RepID=UPI003691B3D5